MKTVNPCVPIGSLRLVLLLVLGVLAGSLITAGAFHGGQHHHGSQNRGYRHDSHYDYYHYDSHRYEKRRHGDRGYDRRRGRFSVPRAIHHDRVSYYKPYYFGRLFHHDHRHYHRIYRFPVYLEGRYVYRPHAYCEGNFFDIGIFTRGGPRFGLSIRF